MFPFLPVQDTGEELTETLLTSMHGPSANNFKIPAGYTYFGQFIDHDITFDTSSQLRGSGDPYGLVNFRTPRLDLDSLYGSGPEDQPFLYDWNRVDDRGVKLLVGTAPEGHADLPRNADGIALVGDPRNDANLIVTQLHLLFLRFHNEIVEQIRGPDLAGRDLFREAQRLTRWHYQWIVVKEFLPLIVDAATLQDVFSPAPPTVRCRYFQPDQDQPFIPVEFSGAAFRFGHSMVRDDYKINDNTITVPIISRSDDPADTFHLEGFRHLPPGLVIDWAFFFKTRDEQNPQPSRAIDTELSFLLQRLPKGISPKRDALPRLNLSRARRLGLPAGRDVAQAMGVQPLADAQLLARFPKGVAAAAGPAVPRAAPLWYYVLREAATVGNGEQLGPVGGRIVAEVLLGLLAADPNSYLRQAPRWTPEFANAAGDFTLADLVRFVP
jgi:hypothetical protein